MNTKTERNKNGTFQKGNKVVHSLATLRKMSESQLGERNHRYGKKNTKEHNLKVSIALKGKKKPLRTEEHNRKISLSKIGCASWNKGKKLSLKHRKNLSISHIGQSFLKGRKFPERCGENHPMWGKKNISITGVLNRSWKGGITSLTKKIRASARSIIWRDKIFQRDDWTCQNCKEKGGKLNADHIKEFSIIFQENKIKSLDDAYKCDELWDLNNGKTLCKECHTEKTRLFMRINWENQYAKAN